MTDPNAKPNSVRDLRGPKADVLTKLASDYDLSPELSAYLAARVDKSPHAGVVLHAHEQTNGSDLHVSISITKLFAWLIAFFILGASALPAAIVSSNLITYAATGGASTNTGTYVYVRTAYITTAPEFLISDGGTTSTNALTVEVQYGLDTNYFSTAATYTKTSTNATEGVISPGVLAVRVYARTRAITTNNVSVGTKAIITQ